MKRQLARLDEVATEGKKRIDYAVAHDPQVQKAMRKILDDALSRARAIINKHRPSLDALVEELIKRETMTRAEVERVIQHQPKLLPKAA